MQRIPRQTVVDRSTVIYCGRMASEELDQRTPAQKAFSALTDLGFHAAEMRALLDRLAAACARQDKDEVCDLAEAIQPYCAQFGPMYIQFLVASTGPHKEERRLHLVPADYIGLQERTSV
jgi:hypothetical protein